MSESARAHTPIFRNLERMMYTFLESAFGVRYLRYQESNSLSLPVQVRTPITTLCFPRNRILRLPVRRETKKLESEPLHYDFANGGRKVPLLCRRRQPLIDIDPARQLAERQVLQGHVGSAVQQETGLRTGCRYDTRMPHSSR